MPCEAVAPLDPLHQEVSEILQRFDLCFKQMIYTYVCIRIPLSRIRMRIQIVVAVVDFDLWISAPSVNLLTLRFGVSRGVN